MFSILKKGIITVYDEIVNINISAGKLTGIKEPVSNGVKYVTKVTGATTGSMGAAKGTVDFVEAVACQDGVCAFVSGVGVIADGLQICTSFIPGPNVTTVITMPVSWGCKTFVWCCKRSKLPWGC